MATHRKTVNNILKFEQERKITVFKKAWEYKTGLNNGTIDACIAVIIQVNGRREVYLSKKDHDWPLDFDAIPDCKMVSSKDFLLPKERNKWMEGILSEGEFEDETAESFQESPSLPSKATRTSHAPRRLRKRPRVATAEESEGQASYTGSEDSDNDRTASRKRGRAPVAPTAVMASSTLSCPTTIDRAPSLGNFGVPRLGSPAAISRSSSITRHHLFEGVDLGDRAGPAPTTPPTSRRKLLPKFQESTIFVSK
ncbi:hypothetical protein LTR12_017186 [Friedmanniomyces endolithicus]|nr:hypothetical protein LTR12_017186 [Friedmanniomyces endolithicus]